MPNVPESVKALKKSTGDTRHTRFPRSFGKQMYLPISEVALYQVTFNLDRGPDKDPRVFSRAYEAQHPALALAYAIADVRRTFFRPFIDGESIVIRKY